MKWVLIFAATVELHPLKDILAEIIGFKYKRAI
jgi:hypothetical protein